MIIAILQARVGSTRLPGKVLKIIQNKTILELIIERVQQSTLVDKIVVATTDNKKDDEILEICEKLGIESFRGSEEDVLDRFYQCSVLHKPDLIIRLTSDCPLIDPYHIDRLIQYSLDHKNEFDYFSNCREPTLPDGLDVEVIPFETLERAWNEAKKPYEREHVSPYIYLNPNLFKIASYKNPDDYSHHRWTLDTSEDFEFIKSIYSHFVGKKQQFFYLDDIIEYLKQNPDIYSINAGYKRDEKFRKQLRENKEK